MEFLLRSTHTCNSWTIRSMHSQSDTFKKKPGKYIFGVIVISSVVFSCLVVIVSGVRAIHQLSLRTSPSLSSHPGPGYWPVIFIITTYYLEQEKSRYITSIPSVLTHSGVPVENREKKKVTFSTMSLTLRSGLSTVD